MPASMPVTQESISRQRMKYNKNKFKKKAPQSLSECVCEFEHVSCSLIIMYHFLLRGIFSKMSH